MSVRDDQVLTEKLKSLPPQRRAEVEDFIDFLRSRDEEQRLNQAAAQLSEPPSRRSGITPRMPNTIGCNHLIPVPRAFTAQRVDKQPTLPI